MANEVKIKVRSDESQVNFDKSKTELGILRAQAVKDANAMAAASRKLEELRRKEAEATEKLGMAEQRLGGIYAENGSVLSKLGDVESERVKNLREAAEAAKALAKAEEILNQQEDEKNKKKQTGPHFDTSKSFLNKNQLLSEAKSYGIEAGAVMGGAIGAGMSTLGAAGLFVGIAAAAQSQNQQVAAAYSKMWDQVKVETQASSSVLAGDFINTAESLGRTFNALQPEMREAFTAAKPVIADVTEGIDRMARTAMPGLVTATQAAGQASNGLGDLMESAGRSVANFFTESSQGAKAGGDAFRGFGVIVERLGSFAGRILAQLANSSGTVWGPMASAVDATATAVESLAQSALPGLASGASFALTGLSMLMTLANALIGVLGPMVPVVMQVASALKLVDMVSFGQVSKSWGEFKGKIGEGEGVFGKLKAGASGLVSTLGPVGLAAGLVTVGLGYLATEQQNAAGAAAAHAKRVDSLTDALRQSKGAIDANVKASAAEALQNMAVSAAYQDGDKIKKNMLQSSRELNIDQGLLTNAYMNQGDALGKLNHQLDAIMSPYKDYNDMVAHANPEEQKRWMLAEQMKFTINKQGGEFATAAQKAADLANAQGTAAVTAGKLAAEFGKMSDKEASAADKLSALMEIMDTFAGRQPDMEQATEQWEKFIDGFNKKSMNFEDKNAGSKKYVQSLIDASGQINLTTADGRKLYDTVREGEKDFDQTAVAMKNSGASIDEIRGKLEPMRKAFIDNAVSMGFTQAQAELLANKYGLIPEQVATMVSSNLSPELQKAIELGGTIRALPDGSFTVTANTSAAQGAITKLIQTNDGRVITIHVNTVNSNAAQLNVSNGSFSRLKAAGGAVSHAAEGGARTGPVTVNEGGRQEAFTSPGGDTFLLPLGGQVIPNANVQAMADQQHFRRQTGAPEITLKVMGGGDAITEMLAQIIREYVRVVGGGNAQAALGWAA